MQAPNTKYWFVLGRESLIAAAEIGAVLNVTNYEYSSQILKVELPPLSKFESKKLIGRLGGTIKIAEEIADNIGEEKMKEEILSELKKVEGKINFGLSFYSPIVLSPFRGETERGVSRMPDNEYPHPALPLKGGGTTHANIKEIKILGLEIKKTLKSEGLSIRYVENKETTLSSVTVEKNGLTNRGREFLIQKNGNRFSLAKTEAVQPFEEFSARDFGRPGRDDTSGMLPPKLAMILINLVQAPKDGVLLDPFCGSGTILSEAMLLGYNNLIGVDISEKAISDTKLNINWTEQRYGAKTNNIKIFQSDIKNIGRHIAKKSIDAIVTEPYLGAPLKGSESQQILRNQASELKTLYIEAFKQFSSLLKPAGAVIFIIPRFKFKNDWITIDCQKDIEALGFKSALLLEQHPYLLYARPNQRVGREIWRFEKK